MTSKEEIVDLTDLDNYILLQSQVVKKVLETGIASGQSDLKGMMEAAKDIRTKLKQLGFRERSTARMLAKVHAYYLTGVVTGLDIAIFLTFIYLASGLPLKSMMELFAAKGKIKKIRNISEEQLPVMRTIIEFIHPKLMECIGLASSNSIVTACG